MSKKAETETETPEVFVQTLVSVGSFPSGKGNVVVTVGQYKDNAPRIYVNRTGEKKSGAYTGKLGGMSAEDAKELAKLLPKAADALAKASKA